MSWYRFSRKGQKWCQREGLPTEFQNSLFLVVHEKGSLLRAIVLTPREAGGYDISGGGALWGGTFADWQKGDSFYTKSEEGIDLPNEQLVLSELGRHYWKSSPEFRDAIERMFVGCNVYKTDPSAEVLQL